ncbi:hypothetical protein BS47DRAFT_1381472 [Hydnum rufescens UP504]|uniref:Uncharacterized protein n=1 Tax=Hydnum rufescens UP504 TaxID=1448309 RepID=A0A9P6DY30_9AGAM|nr:hypothetical protein BS47DRAFT_1381472 [Hydnum rufescens UP504]
MLLWLAGLAPEPLPPDPQTAIENFLIQGHANYLPQGTTKVLNAFEHPDASKLMASINVPDNYLDLPDGDPVCECTVVFLSRVNLRDQQERPYLHSCLSQHPHSGSGLDLPPLQSLHQTPPPHPQPQQYNHTTRLLPPPPMPSRILPMPSPAPKIQPLRYQLLGPGPSTPSPHQLYNYPQYTQPRTYDSTPPVFDPMPHPYHSFSGPQAPPRTQDHSHVIDTSRVVCEIERNTRSPDVPTTTLQIIVDASDPTGALALILQKMGLELPRDNIVFQIPDDCKSVHRELKDENDMHIALELMKDKIAHVKTKLKVLRIFNDQPVEKRKNSQEKKKPLYPQPLSSELSGECLNAFLKLKIARECFANDGSKYCWPQPSKRGEHLPLTNKMMTLWAMEMVSNESVDEDHPPNNVMFDSQCTATRESPGKKALKQRADSPDSSRIVPATTGDAAGPSTAYIQQENPRRASKRVKFELPSTDKFSDDSDVMVLATYPWAQADNPHHTFDISSSPIDISTSDTELDMDVVRFTKPKPMDEYPILTLLRDLHHTQPALHFDQLAQEVGWFIENLSISENAARTLRRAALASI